jgi:hypothetical protein
VTCVTTQVKANEVGKACSTHVRGEKLVQGFGRKARWNGPLGRARRRWEDEIRMDVGEIGLGCGLDWTGSGQGPVAGCCEGGDEPSGSCATELEFCLDVQ